MAPPTVCPHATWRSHLLPALQVLAEALGWMAEAVPDFGLGCMDVGAIIEWMKADLGSPNAPGGWPAWVGVWLSSCCGCGFGGAVLEELLPCSILPPPS